ncbi:MAG TPA: hypothetical protein VM163_05965 [bacterium]|nr:hypothetical protein [bacterium]
MRNSLLISLTVLFVLSGLAFAQEYNEVFTTGWMAADENEDGTPEWENMFMSFLRDINGDGHPDFLIVRSSDTYYTDLTTTDVAFYGADFNPFWTLSGIDVAPLYLSHADMDGDGKTEIVFTGRSDEDSELTQESITSLVEVYETGSSVSEFDFETALGMEIVGLTSPYLKFDNDANPDLLLLGDWFRSYDSYLYRATAVNNYELLWKSEGSNQTRAMQQVDYDFDGDYEVLLSEIDDPYQTSGELKLYDYDAGTDRMIKAKSWYFDQVLILPDQVCDLNGDGSPEMLIRTHDSLRSAYNTKVINGDTQAELFSYGEDLLDDSSTYGAIFWEDGLGGHDLDMDGNPDLLYYSIKWEERADGGFQPAERSCYIAEYQGGTFVNRFTHDPDEELMSVQVFDLDGDGVRELCLYYFTSGTTTYSNRLIVLDPTSNYTEKFRVEYTDEQPVGYTAPIRGNGVDLDGDGVGEFILQVYKAIGTTDLQYRVEIRNGATGALEWQKQFGRGTYLAIDWAQAETAYAGLLVPASDFNGNGKIDFGISELQEEKLPDNKLKLIAAKLGIYECSGGAGPSISVETDKTDYHAGDTIQLKIGGSNPGLAVAVDIYIAIIEPNGSIDCAPSWLPGITAWIPSFVFPGDLSVAPFTIAAFGLPCSPPPINSTGTYWFAGALTPPGEFTPFISLDIAEFHYTN